MVRPCIREVSISNSLLEGQWPGTHAPSPSVTETVSQPLPSGGIATKFDVCQVLSRDWRFEQIGNPLAWTEAVRIQWVVRALKHRDAERSEALPPPQATVILHVAQADVGKLVTEASEEPAAGADLKEVAAELLSLVPSGIIGPSSPASQIGWFRRRHGILNFSTPTQLHAAGSAETQAASQLQS